MTDDQQYLSELINRESELLAEIEDLLTSSNAEKSSINEIFERVDLYEASRKEKEYELVKVKTLKTYLQDKGITLPQ